MLDLIRSFLAVIEAGSVNKAARRLGVSQPTLSRQIQALEAELGAQLFERGAWGMRPTDLAYFTRDSMIPIIKNFDAAIRDMHLFAHGRYYRLRVGYIGSAATRFLNPALAKLKKEYPDLKMMLYDQTPMEQLQSLRDGNIEVAIVGEEVGKLNDEFYQKIAANINACAVVSVDHALSHSKEVSLSDLKNDYFVGVSEAAVPGRNGWIERLCGKAGFHVRFIAKTHDISETFSLVLSEGAVAILPDYFEGPPPPGVVKLRINDPFAQWSLVVLRQRGRGSDASKRLVELVGQS